MTFHKLTPRDHALLDELKALHAAGVEWARPMDMGARDGSWHSSALLKLVVRGYVERKERGSSRSFLYRLKPPKQE